MKKKLLIFHPIIAPYRIDLFNALAKLYNVQVCLFWRNLKDQTFDYSKIEEQFNYKPTYIVKEEIGFLKWMKEIWMKLNSSHSDIVLGAEFGISTIIIILHKFVTRSHYKIVIINDDSYDMLVKNNQFTKRHARAVKTMMPFVDNVINVEPRVAAYNQQKYQKGIYFPIICDDVIAKKRLERVLPISQNYVRKYQLEGKKVLLFVGRLVALKNVEFALRAFIKANLENTVFVIVGDGPEKEKLVKIVAGNPAVIFTGRLEGDELYAWYNVGQVFTLPSYQEPFGAVTNEALVAGCKVLISKDAGSNCLVKDGKNGFIIDPRHKKNFIEKLRLAFYSMKALKMPLVVKENMMISCFEEHVESLYTRMENL